MHSTFREIISQNLFVRFSLFCQHISSVLRKSQPVSLSFARENSWESGRSIGREDTGHRGDSGSDRRKEAGTAGDEYGSGSDDPLYAGDFQRISGCLIS